MRPAMRETQIAAAMKLNSALPASDRVHPSGGGTVLGFDYGTRFIGVAVGDRVTRIAHPLSTIDAEASAARFAAIGALIAEWRPERLVVGVPFSLEGEAHDMTRRAQRFARQLEGRFGLPVATVDERLTSAAAGERLRATGRGGRAHKQLLHPVAAQILLQAYLDDHGQARPA